MIFYYLSLVVCLLCLIEFILYRLAVHYFGPRYILRAHMLGVYMRRTYVLLALVSLLGVSLT